MLTNQKRKRFLIAGICVILVAVGIGYSYLTGGTPVTTSPVDLGAVILTVKEAGTIESESAVVITALYGGTAGEVLVAEGASVKAKDPLLHMAPGGANFDLAGLQAQLSGVKGQLKQAADLAQKNKKLYEQGAISLTEYQGSLTAVTELQAQVSSMQYSIQGYATASGTTGVSAPIDGIVTSVYIKEGQTITAGSPLFEIANLDDLYVKTNLISEDADRVSLGDQAIITGMGDQVKEYEGTVRKIHVKAEDLMSDLGIVQKRVTVELSIPQKENWRLGEDVDATITIDSKDEVLCADNRATFQLGDKDWVYVVKNGKAVLTEVTTGLKGDDKTEVLEGLSQGDRIILSPGNDIDDGTRVKVQ